MKSSNARMDPKNPHAGRRALANLRSRGNQAAKRDWDGIFRVFFGKMKAMKVSWNGSFHENHEHQWVEMKPWKWKWVDEHQFPLRSVSWKLNLAPRKDHVHRFWTNGTNDPIHQFFSECTSHLINGLWKGPTWRFLVEYQAILLGHKLVQSLYMGLIHGTYLQLR